MITKREIVNNFLFENKLIVGLILLAGCLNSISMILVSLSIGKYYQITFGNVSSKGKMLEFLNINFVTDIKYFFFLFISLILTRSIMVFIEKYFSGMMGENFSKNLREALFSHQLSMTTKAHNEKAYGKYLLRYSGDLVSIQSLITRGILLFTCDFLFIFLVILMLLQYDFRVCVILLLFAGIFLGIYFIFINITKGIISKRRDRLSANLAFVNSRLLNFITIKTLNRESVEINKFKKKSALIFEAGKKYQFLSSLSISLLPFILYIMLAFILLYVNIIKNRPQEYLPDSSLITIVILIITIFPILKRTLKVPLIWQSGSISLDKLLILMNKNTENENCEAMGLVKIGKIEFAQVTYCYNKNVNVIQQLSFCIHPNQLTHVRSISSKGKSTIFKLILGLYQPIEGSILIDGHDINQFQAKSLRKNISMMASDLPLLGDTIFEAISYSRKFEKRISAKKLLDELGFFLLGPINIDLEYKIGECGENLSFAQVRILLIARTLLTRKKIILLDDPLIGLDMKLKKLVCSKINELKKSHTIVIVDSSNESMLQIDSVIDI